MIKVATQTKKGLYDLVKEDKSDGSDNEEYEYRGKNDDYDFM